MATRTFAGEIESAVGADFNGGADFGAAFGTGENDDGQRRTAIDADVFVFQRESMAFRADE